MSRSRRISALLLALSLATCAARVSFAQINELPAQMIESVVLSGDQDAEVKRYAEFNLPGLTDAAKRREARAAILRPLDNARASADFRFKYSKALLPKLQQLSGSTDDVVAINALVVCGELATPDAASLVVSKLADSKPQIRYQAAYGLRRTFEAMVNSPRAIDDGGASQLIRDTAARLAAEKDPLVTIALIEAALQSCSIPKLEGEALKAISSAMGAQSLATNAKTATPQQLFTLVKVGQGVRDMLANMGGQLPADAVKSASELGGRLVGVSLRAIETKSVPMPAEGTRSEVRDLHVQISTLGQNIAKLASTSLSPSTPIAMPEGSLGDLLKKGSVRDDASFAEDARKIIGPGGVMTKEPFGFAADSLVGKK